MVEGDSGSPTWKFTQYVLSPALPSSVFASAQVDLRLPYIYILLCLSIEALRKTFRPFLELMLALITDNFAQMFR
jgi:hypothetical protein